MADEVPKFFEETPRNFRTLGTGEGPIDDKKNGADDEALVEAARTDLDAFAEVIRRHQDFVFGAVLRVVRNPVVAEDLAQETFIRAYRGLEGFRGDAHIRSWLYRIATNLSYNWVTRRREVPTADLPEAHSRSQPERDVELADLREHLIVAIDQLPIDLRKPLMMREYDGLSYQQIADETGLPLNTVRTRLLRARRALQAEMEPWR